MGRQAFQNEQKYGAATWYKWRIRNWGTKWNAYGYEGGVQFDGKSLRFQTAGSPPKPIVTKLSEMYPDLDFTHQWADEDIGHVRYADLYEKVDGKWYIKRRRTTFLIMDKRELGK